MFFVCCKTVSRFQGSCRMVAGRWCLSLSTFQVSFDGKGGGVNPHPTNLRSQPASLVLDLQSQDRAEYATYLNQTRAVNLSLLALSRHRRHVPHRCGVLSDIEKSPGGVLGINKWHHHRSELGLPHRIELSDGNIRFLCPCVTSSEASWDQE